MAIDRAKAINDLSQIKFKENEDGLIITVGALFTQFPTTFWNSFTKKIIQASGDDLYEAATALLENAAAECAYTTGWIMSNSEEFKAIVAPMIEKDPEDVLHGLYAFCTALGWTNAEVVELIPGEKMVVRAYDYYEDEVKDIFKTPKLCGYMNRGIHRAFFDLIYGDKPYPDGLGKFKCKQTKGIECGDIYGEFIVTEA